MQKLKKKKKIPSTSLFNRRCRSWCWSSMRVSTGCILFPAISMVGEKFLYKTSTLGEACKIIFEFKKKNYIDLMELRAIWYRKCRVRWGKASREMELRPKPDFLAPSSSSINLKSNSKFFALNYMRMNNHGGAQCKI